MFARNDRSINRGGPWLVVVLLIAVGAGTYLWVHVRQSSNDFAERGVSAVVTAPSKSAEAPRQVTLLVPRDGALVMVGASIARQREPQLEAREAIAALLAAEDAAGSPVLHGLRLRSLSLDAAGTAYIDFESKQPEHIRSSAWDELLGLYAVVDTAMYNVPEVKQVRLLLDGREAATLAGHMDLMRPFTKRMDLVKE